MKRLKKVNILAFVKAILKYNFDSSTNELNYTVGDNHPVCTQMFGFFMLSDKGDFLPQHSTYINDHKSSHHSISASKAEDVYIRTTKNYNSSKSYWIGARCSGTGKYL